MCSILGVIVDQNLSGSRHCAVAVKKPTGCWDSSEYKSRLQSATILVHMRPKSVKCD
uniref:Uncharacterized protein n=1 Tax=Anguilla anguilla TaxID=7936 RepID=A0A0E9XMN7_ANGAN